MRKKRLILSWVIFFFSFVDGDNTNTTSLTGDEEQYQPLNIVSIKQDYYKKQGLEVLPEVLTDTTLGPGQYVAINNVTIKKGCGVTLNPGTTLWFEPQKKLIVEGILIGSSMDNDKIRLTYIPSRDRYLKITIPESLWNGIIVEDGGSLLLNRIIISYATTGITTGSGKTTLDLACIDMSENVGVHLNYNGKVINGEDSKCFGLQDIERGLKSDEIAAKNEEIKKQKEAASKKRFIFRIGSGAISTLGIGVGIYGFYNFEKYKKLYVESYIPEDIANYRSKALNSFSLGIAGSVVTVLGITGFTLTFVF